MRDTHQAALYINVASESRKHVLRRVHRNVSSYLEFNVNRQHQQPAVCYHKKIILTFPSVCKD